MPNYAADFPVGSTVLVAGLARLEEFRRTWKFHHPLEPRQLAFAGRSAVVERVEYYHGGDVLYRLTGVPGTWHECCLQAARPESG